MTPSSRQARVGLLSLACQSGVVVIVNCSPSFVFLISVFGGGGLLSVGRVSDWHPVNETQKITNITSRFISANLKG